MNIYFYDISKDEELEEFCAKERNKRKCKTRKEKK